MSMTDYLKKISVAKEKLASTSEKLHDSQVILIALGGLGPEYQPFVTSITTRFDHSMTFSSFQHLLMDHDLQFSVQRQTAVPFEAHAIVRSGVKSDDQVPKSKLQCQLCTRKGHVAVDCYNRISFGDFPQITPVS